jgi:ubiquinone/menaquinone biosynthesis C-methylase UbiE
MESEFGKYYRDKNVADSYEEIRSKGLKGAVVRKLERKYVEILVNGSGKDILEAGIGTGFITEVLRKYGHITGFDISRAMMEKVKKKFKDIKLVEGNILDLRLKGKYDSVVSIRVLSHFDLKDAKKALANLAKLTKTGGHVIFNLENVSSLRVMLRKLSGWGSTKNYQYSSRDIKELLRSAGLKPVKILYIDHLFFVPLHLMNKLLFNTLEKFIFNLELKFSKVKFMSNNSYIKCQK